MQRRLGVLGVIVILPIVGPGATATAQALASPFSTISQKVDSTTITIEYYRPSVRGRTIFGRLVRWARAARSSSSTWASP